MNICRTCFLWQKTSDGATRICGNVLSPNENRTTHGDDSCTEWIARKPFEEMGFTGPVENDA